MTHLDQSIAPREGGVKAETCLGTLHIPGNAAFCCEIPRGDSSVLGAGMQVFKNLIFLIKNTRGGQALSLIQEESLFVFPPVLPLLTSLTLSGLFSFSPLAILVFYLNLTQHSLVRKGLVT